MRVEGTVGEGRMSGGRKRRRREREGEWKGEWEGEGRREKADEI